MSSPSEGTTSRSPRCWTVRVCEGHLRTSPVGGCIRWRGGAARGPDRAKRIRRRCFLHGPHTSPRPGGSWGATTPSRAEMTPSPQGPPGRRRPVRRRRAAQPSPVASRPAGARSRGPSHRLSSAPPSSIGSSCSSCADAVSGLARPCAVRVHPGGLADVVRPKRTMGRVFNLALSSPLTSSHSVPSARPLAGAGARRGLDVDRSLTLSVPDQSSAVEPFRPS